MTVLQSIAHVMCDGDRSAWITRTTRLHRPHWFHRIYRIPRCHWTHWKDWSDRMDWKYWPTWSDRLTRTSGTSRQRPRSASPSVILRRQAFLYTIGLRLILLIASFITTVFFSNCCLSPDYSYSVYHDVSQ